VLRPGGRLLLLDWSRDRWTMRLLNAWLRLRRDPFRRMYPRREMRSLLRDAGFRIAGEGSRTFGVWALMAFDARAE
jgi:ubiquinone/menaquinone biosynthesis C-methylase UbiE